MGYFAEGELYLISEKDLIIVGKRILSTGYRSY
jgi:hypothetical protein